MRLMVFQSRGFSPTISFNASIALSGLPARSAASASCRSLTWLTLATSPAPSREEPRLSAVEGPAMDRRRAHAPQRVAVQLAAVAHVAREPVARVLGVELNHQGVASDLGHDRRGGDRDRE